MSALVHQGKFSVHVMQMYVKYYVYRMGWNLQTIQSVTPVTMNRKYYATIEFTREPRSAWIVCILCTIGTLCTVDSLCTARTRFSSTLRLICWKSTRLVTACRDIAELNARVRAFVRFAPPLVPPAGPVEGWRFFSGHNSGIATASHGRRHTRASPQCVPASCQTYRITKPSLDRP